MEAWLIKYSAQWEEYCASLFHRLGIAFRL